MVIFLYSIHDNSEETALLDNPVFYVSKTVMVIGFCISIYMRLKTEDHHGNRINRNILNNRNDSEVTESMFNITADDMT